MSTATDTPSTTSATPPSGSETSTTQTPPATTAVAETSTQAAATSAAPPDGAAAPDAPWQDALPDDLKTNPLFRNYKSPEEAMKAHANLYKQRGIPAERLLTVPEKPQDQAPDDWAPIHKALGVPDDPKDYQIELAPEAAADTPELAEILRELGGKAKFQPSQMAAVIETLNALGQKAAQAEAEALDAETRTVTETLNKEWGAAAEGNRRAIGKLIRDALGGQIDEDAQADLQTKLGSNLTLSRVLAHAIGKMAEPQAPEGAGAATTTRQLTPAAAQAALNAFHGNAEKMAALNSKNHPQHGAVLEERRQLLAQARGEKRPDQPS
nr:hypothetical protein [Brevundimonas diminuta]